MNQIDPNNPPNPSNPAPSPEPVLDPREEEIQNLRAEAARLKAEKELSDQRFKDQQVAAHKGRDEWKSVAELREQEAKEWKEKYQGLSEAVIANERLKSVTAEAVKHGIDPRALPDLEWLDFPEITVERTNTGRITVSGAARAIERLKSSRPHWFTVKNPAIDPSLPSTHSAGPVSGSVTIDQLLSLEAKWKKSGSLDDQRVYKEALIKYNSQRH